MSNASRQHDNIIAALPPPTGDRVCTCSRDTVCGNCRAWDQRRKGNPETPPDAEPIQMCSCSHLGECEQCRPWKQRLQEESHTPRPKRPRVTADTRRARLLACLAEQGPQDTHALMIKEGQCYKTTVTSIMRALVAEGRVIHTSRLGAGPSVWSLPGQAIPEPPPKPPKVRKVPKAATWAEEGRHGVVNPWTFREALQAIATQRALQQRPLTAHDLETLGGAVPTSRTVQAMLQKLGWENISAPDATRLIQAFAQVAHDNRHAVKGVGV